MRPAKTPDTLASESRILQEGLGVRRTGYDKGRERCWDLDAYKTWNRRSRTFDEEVKRFRTELEITVESRPNKSVQRNGVPSADLQRSAGTRFPSPIELSIYGLRQRFNE